MKEPKAVPEMICKHAATCPDRCYHCQPHPKINACKKAPCSFGGHDCCIPVSEYKKLKRECDTTHLWICGQYKSGLNVGEVRWEFQGVFDNHDSAKEACRDNSYFIFPVELNAECPHETTMANGVEFPGRDNHSRTSENASTPKRTPQCPLLTQTNTISGVPYHEILELTVRDIRAIALGCPHFQNKKRKSKRH